MNQSNISADNLPNTREEIINIFNALGNNTLARVKEIIDNNPNIPRFSISIMSNNFIFDINNINFGIANDIRDILTSANINKYEIDTIYGVLLTCYTGINAIKENDIKHILECLCSAFSYSEKFEYYQLIMKDYKQEVAKKSHKDTNNHKKDVITYYKENFNVLKDESAEYIAREIIAKKITFGSQRTIAGWINKYRSEHEWYRK